MYLVSENRQTWQIFVPQGNKCSWIDIATPNIDPDAVCTWPLISTSATMVLYPNRTLAQLNGLELMDSQVLSVLENVTMDDVSCKLDIISLLIMVPRLHDFV